MKIEHCVILAVAAVVSGCGFGGNWGGNTAPSGGASSSGVNAGSPGGSGGSSWQPNTGSASGSGGQTETDAVSHCSGEGGEAADALYQATRSSVHELITCGGMQVAVAQKLLLHIVTSNPELFSEESWQVLAGFGLTQPENPFYPAPGGVWETLAAAGTDSWFSLRFFLPESDEPVLANPFTLDAYLLGATVDAEMSAQEMIDNISQKNVYTFHWEALGPLGALLETDGPLPNPIVVEASAMDFLALYLGWSDSREPFGPFAGVVDAEMTSEMVFDDERNGRTITYTATSERATVGTVATDGIVAFGVTDIDGTDGTFVIHGDPSSITYLDRKLAGQIDYTVTGPAFEAAVTSDFGTGASYPKARWQCPEAQK